LLVDATEIQEVVALAVDDILDIVRPEVGGPQRLLWPGQHAHSIDARIPHLLVNATKPV